MNNTFPCHPSRFALDQLQVGTLHDPEGQVRAHVDSCPRCQARLEEMALVDTSFLECYPTEAELRRRKPNRPSPRPFWQLWIPIVGSGLAVAAALLFVLFPTWRKETNVIATERIKGANESSVMEIAIRRNDSSFPYLQQRLRGGDVLVFRYSSPRSFLMLLSLEASGKVSLLLPSNGITSMPIKPGAIIPLKQSIELDDYLGAERLIVLFSDTPLSTKTVMTELQEKYASLKGVKLKNLELGPLSFAGDQQSWLLKKELP